MKFIDILFLLLATKCAAIIFRNALLLVPEPFKSINSPLEGIQGALAHSDHRRVKRSFRAGPNCPRMSESCRWCQPKGYKCTNDEDCCRWYAGLCTANCCTTDGKCGNGILGIIIDPDSSTSPGNPRLHVNITTTEKPTTDDNQPIDLIIEDDEVEGDGVEEDE